MILNYDLFRNLRAAGAERRFVELTVHEIIVGAAASAAELTELTLSAFTREHILRELSVVGKAVGILPDRAERFAAQIAFVEALVIH